MRYDRIALCCLFLAVPYPSALAQGWPSWADDVFPDGRSSRSERPFYRDIPERLEPSPPYANPVQDGGARPDIAPRTPPVVAFSAAFPARSIVIDTGARKLYYVLEGNRAYEYAVSVGREGFNWTGIETVSRRQAWPDWHPPAEMRERDPSLPEKMTGGVRNPLGAVALYLGSTLYRIHGTNDVKSIGRAQSSGCFRMLNSDVLHLASLTEIGTMVSVVGSLSAAPEISRAPTPRPSQEHTPRALPGSLAATRSETPPAERASDYQSLRDQMLRRP
jgi:lipoprotein-anchoring transpeptidase ErfK/SrfK